MAALDIAPAGDREQGAGEVSVIAGNEEVAQHLALWVIGQRPWLARDPGIYLEFKSLPPDFPKKNYNGVKTEEDFARVTNRYLDAIVEKATDYSVPERIVVDVKVSLIQNLDGSQVRFLLSDASTPHANMGLEETVPAALRTLHIQSPYKSGMTRLTEISPVPLPLPEGLIKDKTEVTVASRLRQWVDVFPESNLYVRFTLALQEGRIMLPMDTGTVTRNNSVAAEIQMHVLDAVLIRQPWGGKKGARPEEMVVHHWELENANAPMSATSMDSLAEVAARYNLGTSDDGRLIHLNSFLRNKVGLGAGKDGWGGGAHRAADLTLRAAAVIRAYPERRLDQRLAVKLAFEAMLPTERDAILPVGFQPKPRDSSMNELEWSIALRKAEPQIRQAMLAYAPRLPLPVRSYVYARLEEYSLELGGFPVRVEGGLDWLPVPPAEVGLDSKLKEIPDFLQIDEEAALALLERLRLASDDPRRLLLALDFEVGEISVPVLERETTITENELNNVVIPIKPERLALLEDIAGTRVLVERRIEQQEMGENKAFPDDYYATSVDSLRAAMLKFEGGLELVSEGVGQYQGIFEASASAKPSLVAKELERLTSLVRETYLVGAKFSLDKYDEERRGFPAKLEAFYPVVHDQDVTRFRGPPDLVTNDRDGYAFLPATATEAARISTFQHGNDIMTLVRVRPLGIDKYQLVVSRPSEVMIGPLLAGGPALQRIALTIEMAAKPQFEAVSPQVISPPERFYLDHETVDLFALASAAELYDDGSFRRMMLERIAKERFYAKNEAVAPWGMFFKNSHLELTEKTLTELLPAFTDWTKARAAALPDRVILSIGGRHPVTDCQEFHELERNKTALTVSARYDDILGASAGVLAQGFGQYVSGSSPLPGGDRVFAMSGRPSQTTQLRDILACGWLKSGSDDDIGQEIAKSKTDTLPYVDAIVVAHALPSPGSIKGQPDVFDYHLRLEDVSIKIVERGDADLPGFRGVLVFDAQVEGIDVWSKEKGKPSSIVKSVKPEDWLVAMPQNAAALDILGLTIGAQYEEFKALAVRRLPEGISYHSIARERRGLFDEASAVVKSDGSETLLAITRSVPEGKQVIGLMRHLVFAPGKATSAAVRGSLVKKYGAASREERGELYWGVPSKEIDGYQVCGGPMQFANFDAPMASADDKDKTVQDTTGIWSETWNIFGWPRDIQGMPEPFVKRALPYCGPIISARIRETIGDQVDLTLWLHDLNFAIEVDKRRGEEKENVTLDIDL